MKKEKRLALHNGANALPFWLNVIERKLQIDDVYTTGILANSAGVRVIDRAKWWVMISIPIFIPFAVGSDSLLTVYHTCSRLLKIMMRLSAPFSIEDLTFQVELPPERHWLPQEGRGMAIFKHPWIHCRNWYRKSVPASAIWAWFKTEKNEHADLR